jgi:methionine-gamma-lyase
MAATTMPDKGRHVVALRPLYGGSDHLLNSKLLGLDVTWAEPDRVGDALRPDTALVLVETPANPTLRMVDIAEVVHLAHGTPVLVDSTFATPILQNPLTHGARLVLHSATKFLGGHGDVVGGVVACDAAWAAALRQVRVATGALLHPLAAYLLHRGLQTLSLRVERAQHNANILARRLIEHPLVRDVHYPAFRKTDPRGLVGRQMRGPGALLAIELDPSRADIQTLFDRLALITPAVSLGSVDTLIQHPASLTHRPVPAEARQSSGIHEGLLRLSVGIEDVEDLWRDLEGALDALK